MARRVPPETFADAEEPSQKVARTETPAVAAVSAALAAEYKADPDLATVDEQVDSMIHWESGKGFASGFVTGQNIHVNGGTTVH